MVGGIFSGFNDSLWLGASIGILGMFLRAGLCIFTGCSEEGLTVISVAVFSLWTLMILSSIPLIHLLCTVLRNSFAPGIEQADFELVGGLMGSIGVYLLLDAWRENGTCMRQLSCKCAGMEAIFYFLQTLGLKICEDPKSDCFRWVINSHWLALAIAVLACNFLITSCMGRDSRGSPPGGSGNRSRSQRSQPGTPNRSAPAQSNNHSAFLRERVTQETVTLMDGLGRVLCEDCSDTVRTISDRVRDN